MQRTKLFKNLPNDACYDRLTTPVGELLIVANDKALQAIFWDKDCRTEEFQRFIETYINNLKQAVIQETKQQLKEYFQTKRKQFDLPLAFNGTAFQQQAWQTLLQIPYGETRSYGQQANNIGNKNKARAVGLANALNPISIVVPCHRVIGANGKLTGFGGGVDRKAYLLALERTGGK